MSNYKEKLLKVNTFIFDYDGVMTDGTVFLTNDGDALRTANVKDGYALQLAIKKNYRIAIISGAYSESVRRRFESLNIKDVFLGVEKKIDVYLQYLETNKLENENILFMGDDIRLTASLLLRKTQMRSFMKGDGMRGKAAYL